MSDNKSLEPLFNDDLSESDGLVRNLRVTHPKSVLEGYYISDQDVGSTSYYGYQNKDGAWYIMRGVTSGAVTNYTYVAGVSGYATAWTNRTTQTYQTFADAF